MNNLEPPFTSRSIGCSALSLSSNDGNHIFARTFDYPSLGKSCVLFIPRSYEYKMLEHAPKARTHTSMYASIGMGVVGYSCPTLFDGVNEKGLCGGTLYFTGSAAYETNPQAKQKINPAFSLTVILSSCASVEEACAFFEDNDLSNEELAVGKRLSLHFFFIDSAGETAIIEPMQKGITLYRDGIGVLTNSPDYAWHLANLRNYTSVSSTPQKARKFLGKMIQPFGLGGGLALPGDFSSPSRFVRLAFAKDALPAAADERDGITKAFSALTSVTLSEGLVQGENGEPEETLYTAAMCAETQNYYISMHANRRLTVYNLPTELEGKDLLQFPLPMTQDIAMGNF